jgi:hypothetical protein
MQLRPPDLITFSDTETLGNDHMDSLAVSYPESSHQVAHTCHVMIHIRCKPAISLRGIAV